MLVNPVHCIILMSNLLDSYQTPPQIFVLCGIWPFIGNVLSILSKSIYCHQSNRNVLGSLHCVSVYMCVHHRNKFMKMKSFNNTDSEYPVHSSTCLHVSHRGKHWWGKIMVNLLLLKACLVKCVNLFNSKLITLHEATWDSTGKWSLRRPTHVIGSMQLATSYFIGGILCDRFCVKTFMAHGIISTILKHWVSLVCPNLVTWAELWCKWWGVAVHLCGTHLITDLMNV